MAGPGLVQQGTRCGSGLACINQRCRPSSEITTRTCPIGSNGQQCSGNGVSRGHNHYFTVFNWLCGLGIVKPVYIATTSGPQKHNLNRAGLFMEVKINYTCTSTIGTQPGGLYREVISGYRWFHCYSIYMILLFRQSTSITIIIIMFYTQICNNNGGCSCNIGFFGSTCQNTGTSMTYSMHAH